MRPIFQTDYGQDIRLFRHSGYWRSYGVLLLLVLAAPFVVGSYLQSQIVFVFIYAIVGVGLLILAGFAGQVSLGHTAFLAIGAYTAGYTRDVGIFKDIETGIGANATVYRVPSAIQPYYGVHPWGVNVYVRLRIKPSQQ